MLSTPFNNYRQRSSLSLALEILPIRAAALASHYVCFRGARLGAYILVQALYFGDVNIQNLITGSHNLLKPMIDKPILPSVTSLGTLTINDVSKTGFGYNPSVGPSSNAITAETSSLLLNKRLVNLTPTLHSSIYDRNTNTKKISEISLLTLSFLFCEIVSWAHGKSKGVLDLEGRLNGLGYQIGQRYLELVKLREGMKYSKREIRIIEILQFIHGPFWKAIFGKTANELEKSQDVHDEYMIIDNTPLISKFISIPKEYGDLNCSAFVAGIVEGALDSSGFHATVVAHSAPTPEAPLRTVFLIKFDESLFTREEIRFN